MANRRHLETRLHEELTKLRRAMDGVISITSPHDEFDRQEVLDTIDDIRARYVKITGISTKAQTLAKWEANLERMRLLNADRKRKEDIAWGTVGENFDYDGMAFFRLSDNHTLTGKHMSEVYPAAYEELSKERAEHDYGF